MTYFSAPINIPNMKALAQILLEISCTQDFQILFSKGHNSEKGHNLGMKKNMCQLCFHEEYMYMKFQNPKVNQVFYSSAPTNIPNMKALAQILLEISCTQDFHILFSKGHNSEKGHNSDLKKNMGQLFFHEEFQNPSIHRSKVNRRTHPHTHTQTSQKQYALPTFSKLGFFKVGGINMSYIN